MTFKFSSINKAQAEKFQNTLKSERGIESTLVEKDGKFLVEYAIAEVSIAAKKKKACSKKDEKSEKSEKSEEACKDMSKASNELQKCCEEEEEEGVDEEDVQEMLSQMANYIFREMQYQTNWLAAEIAYIENALYKHVSSGHLPPINGADKLQKALEVLGISGDYEVRKPVVFASTRNGIEASVDITK